MKFRLVENWLVESIDSSYEYYKSKIEREDFDRLIRLDPTFKENVNKLGNYGKWILNNYLKPESDVKSNEGHIKDCLIRFEENKKNLINSDIMKFKSLSEIDDYLNDEQSYKEQSHRQEVRQRQKDRKNADLNTEAELIYEDSDWEVWVPKTYAASCKLGQGAQWCTATTEDDYYYNYYKDKYGGDYYINISKHNPNEKYQFHFESKQFMNIKDKSIDLQNFFNENVQLYNLYSKKFNLKKFGAWSKEEYEDYLKNGFIYTKDCEYVPKWVTKIIVDDNVKELPNSRFQDCKSLTLVDLKNVTEIGDFCFSYCESLTTIDLKNVTELGTSCFSYCDSLTTIDLRSVTKLGIACFAHCNSLTSIDLKNATELGEYCFSGCKSLTTIDLKNVTELGQGCFQYCHSLTSIDLKNVTHLDDNCFVGCDSLTTIDLKNVTELGDNCFEQCTSLTTIDLKNVTKLGGYCFKGCKSLTTIDLKNVTKLSAGCFLWCYSLKEIICHNKQQVQMCKKQGLKDKVVLKESLRGNKMKFKLI